ncbi:hypothetical protein FHG87_016350 [Trinorchestia longiramus]|nr:hypothetical protein FHG87_016350 [Trinorchestia longiramus]
MSIISNEEHNTLCSRPQFLCGTNFQLYSYAAAAAAATTTTAATTTITTTITTTNTTTNTTTTTTTTPQHQCTEHVRTIERRVIVKQVMDHH